MGDPGGLESTAATGEKGGLIIGVIRHCGRALSQNVWLPGKGRSGRFRQKGVKVFFSGTLEAVPRTGGRGAFALWLACHTQDEIAAAVDMTQRAISEWEDDFRKKLEVDIFLNPADFEVPIYNVWKQQTKTAGGFYE